MSIPVRLTSTDEQYSYILSHALVTFWIESVPREIFKKFISVLQNKNDPSTVSETNGTRTEGGIALKGHRTGRWENCREDWPWKWPMENDKGRFVLQKKMIRQPFQNKSILFIPEASSNSKKILKPPTNNINLSIKRVKKLSISLSVEELVVHYVILSSC